jgi:hypothetical protein
MKKRYDITFTIEMSDKQYDKLCKKRWKAEEHDEDSPQWNMGEAALEDLRFFNGVKAELLTWSFRRSGTTP